MKFRFLDRLILAAIAAYGLLLLAAWLSLHVAADSHWWATVLLFSPRWIWALPLAPLAIAIAISRRWQWLACLLPLVAGVLCLLGVHCAWPALLEPPSLPPELRILSCNCDDRSLRPDAMRRLIVDLQPDVVALQDVDVQQMAAIFSDLHWHLYPGTQLYLASRFPIRAAARADHLGFGKYSGDMVRYELDIDGTIVQFFNLHMATPRFGLEAVRTGLWMGADKLQKASDERRAQSLIASRWMADYDDVIVAGDFNTPSESPVFRESFGGFADAFSVAGWGIGNTYFRGYNGLRIDHILSDARWQCRACWVGADVGSEHRPVMAVLARPAK